MRRHPIILVALLLVIVGWTLWARWPTPHAITTIQPRAIAQDSPPPTPTMTPTPLAPMPTPAMTIDVGDDWLTYTSPYLGFSFRYPPEHSVVGPESNEHLLELPEKSRYANLLGPPTVIVPAPGKLGSIGISLESYYRLPDTPLAEWIQLNNEWQGLNSLWGFSPFQLTTLPASYLPAGVEQGVFGVNDRPYNAAKVIWLQRGDLVYRLASSYNRPEDLALTLAVISTLKFDPAVEAKIRASGAFHGDDDTLRQQLADAQPEPTPECDISCQDQHDYIARVVAPAATAKALPPLERPTPVSYAPLPVGEDWITYTQPVMGISFRHPPGMSVVDPFWQQQLDDNEATRWGIALIPTIADSDRIWTMRIMPYLLGKDTPLDNWEAIYDQWIRAGRRDDNFNFPYRAVTYINPIYFPRQADNMIMVNGGIYISVDNIVYQVGAATETLPLAAAILSTLEFDEEHLAKLHSLDIFLGDEQQMVDGLVQAWATPTPHVIPTPTPTVRATVPAAFESPLVNGLRQFHGNSDDHAHTPYRLLFDPETWQWTADADGSNYLTHQHLTGCELIPGRGIYEVPSLAPVELAGEEWAIGYLSRGDEMANGLMYFVGWDGGYFQALLWLAEPLPAPYDPNNKSRCQLDAEAVLDTITYTPVPPTPTATPTPIVTPSPTIRATVTPVASESPLVNGKQRYQGASYLHGQPPFELWFDPQNWHLAVDENGNDYLVHQSIAPCEIMLQAYLQYHAGLPPVTLDGVEWRVAYPMDTTREYLAYTRAEGDFEYTYFVTLPISMPTPYAYDPDNKSQCQLDAEAVFATHVMANGASLLPTVTPAWPVTPAPQRYEGQALIEGMPPFEVTYDAARWELTEGSTGMNYLVHRTIENCTLALKDSEREATLIAHTVIGRQWVVYQVNDHTFVYRATNHPWGEESYRFTATYREPILSSDQFHMPHESVCRHQIDEIIASFRILD